MSVPAAIAAIARGEIVVVADHENRENEGDLILAASHATAEKLAFMVRHTSGIVCVSLPAKRLEQLGLPLMVTENSEIHRTAFTVSVDLEQGTTTGVSAADRARTILALADDAIPAGAFSRPGHIFPLRSTRGGVLRRPGHTEAALDLVRLAGLPEAGVLCELVNEDGSMMRGAQLREFASAHNLVFTTVDELITHRRSSEKIVTRVAEARLPTKHGEFQMYLYRSELDGIEHVALVAGAVDAREDVLVRVHSECFTGDVLSSLRCDCGTQLDRALAIIQEEGCGAVIYLRDHEGRGIGLRHKMHAYSLQDLGRDTVEANEELGFPVDVRRYDVGAQIITDLGIRTLRLLSNNPAKFTELANYDFKITARVPLVVEPNDENRGYLEAKQRKLGHALHLGEGI